MIRNLIYKELKLFIMPATYCFTLLAALLLIPAYPYVVAMCYFFIPMQINFSVGRANKDNEFTSILPVPRRQIVLSKVISVVCMELAQFFMAIPFALISSLIINKNGNPVGMDANFAFFGLSLIYFGVYNLVFLSTYFKSGYKSGLALLRGMIAYSVIVMFCEILIAFTPAKAVLDSLDPSTFGAQLVFLLFGIVFYAGITYAAYRISNKNFENVNL